MATKTVRYDLLVNDRLGAGMTEAARATDKAAASMDIASRTARVLDRALASQRKAADASAGASLALARADKILEEAEHGLRDGALEAEFALKRQGAAAKGAAAQTAAAGAAASAGAGGFGSMGGAMGAAVAAGVALSPVIVTLATGFGGLGLAALSVAKNTKLMGQVLAPLKSEFHSFSESLQPEILSIFNEGVGIAGHLLRDIQPVARATGVAFRGFLGQVDKTFASGQWQQFFRFMADTAAPDMKLLGDNILQLVNLLPPLLTDIQPLAVQFLTLSDNALKAAGAVANFGKSTDKTSASVGTNTGLLGFLSKAVANVNSFMKPGGVLAGALADALGGIPSSAGKAGDSMHATAGHAYTLAGQLAAAQKATTSLMNAENAALSPMLAYSNALITQRNDADKLSAALKTSHDRIGLNTDAERASFSAANTYIQDLLNTAQAAVKSHQGIDAQISSIRGALPLLQNVKGGTKQYWQEVSTLVGWLHKLQAIKLITEAIHVSGTGVWTVTPGKIGLPGGTAGGPFPQAAGGLITGGTPGRDSVLGMLMPGEVVVPAGMVRAGAVDHLRGQLPRFATGGVVGSYPKLPGMGPWAVRELRATEGAIARSVAVALVAGIKAAAARASAGGVSGAGPVGGDAAANKRLARSMFPWPASMWASYDYLEMREAGYNRFARNPSSGAYGIPQALPPTKMPLAAQAAGGSHAGPQIAWMYNYISGRYGNPVNAAAHERSFNWYGGGLDAVIGRPTLIGVGERGPEHVTVTPGSGGGDLGARLDQLIALNRELIKVAAAAPAATGRHVACPADAAFRRRYPGR